MISDVLSDAGMQIDEYLNNETFADAYSGTLREAVVDVRNRMQALRVYLDIPPGALDKAGEREKFEAHWRKHFSAAEIEAVKEVFAKVDGGQETIEDILAQLT